MNQTSIIAGGLLVAFLVFVTVRGQLPCYLNVLGISNASCTAGQAAAVGASVITGGNTLTSPIKTSGVNLGGVIGGITGGLIGGGGIIG